MNYTYLAIAVLFAGIGYLALRLQEMKRRIEILEKKTKDVVVE